ncbi:MAG TPA: acyl-ACP--UDP-N-acetylglucosamine O-acyltransferase [Vicinamibacterales bacterium]|nr:acyl-ACP--UDP-N-acetylglucosamine O-acyltransferase [Vicinamibacterales bacterium]
MSSAEILDRLAHRFPSLLVDSVAEHEPGKRLVALKNVTVNEEFFQGHFPSKPLMPAVLTIEALAQAATLLLLTPAAGSNPEDSAPGSAGHPSAWQVTLRGVDDAKFRKHVVPGDQLKLTVTRGATRGPLVRAAAVAEVDGQVVAEAELLLAITAIASIDPLARVAATARIGAGTTVGPFAVIGPNVQIGRHCRIGALAVIDGHTSIGDGTEVFPYASIGLAPQDLKYKGEPTRLEIGAGNIFREFVTIHRGTEGGGGVTTIGDRNLFMNYVHVAHDCHVGNHTIFGPHATLGGHVTISDFVNVSAGSAVHQFCRVGAYAFIGGYSVITKDALPYGRTVGSRPARVFGLNLIGLKRRGFADDTLKKLRAAYRYLMQSRLNATQAIAKIEADPSLQCPEVDNLVDFIRTASRGVILRRSGKVVDGTEE